MPSNVKYSENIVPIRDFTVATSAVHDLEAICAWCAAQQVPAVGERLK